MDAAADGDVLIVRHSFYLEAAHAVIDDKSLTIVGEPVILSPPAFVAIAPGVTIRNLSPAKTVIVENVFLIGHGSDGAAPPTTAVTLQDNQGHVRIQYGSEHGGIGGSVFSDGVPGVIADDCASVVLVNLSCRGDSGAFSPHPETHPRLRADARARTQDVQ